MGGHYLEDILYGIGSFKDGEFTRLQEQVIYGDRTNNNLDYKKYDSDVSKLNQWLSSPCKPSDLMGDFISCNLKSYLVNRSMSIAEVKRAYGVDITKALVYFLLPGRLEADESKYIYVTYAFKGFIIAEFESYVECGKERADEGKYAFVFIGQGPVDKFNNFEKDDYGYDCVNVTGIIMRK